MYFHLFKEWIFGLPSTEKFLEECFWGNLLYLSNFDFVSDKSKAVSIVLACEQVVVWSCHAMGGESVSHD